MLRKVLFHQTEKVALLLFLLILMTVVIAACSQENEPEAENNVLEAETSPPESENNDPENRTRADLVLQNGAVYTVNDTEPWAEAVAVKDGVIVFVGQNDAATEWIGDQTQVIDLQGKMVMPGFQDPHLHALEAGVNVNLCLFEREASFDDYIREIRACAEQQADTAWVRGAGVSMAALLHRERLPIDVLDEAVPDRPVLILDDLGHGAWANTLAMQAAGYDQVEGNPPGGILDREAATGRLSGVVLENVQQALRTASFEPNAENMELAYQGLLRALGELAQNGITTVSDAGGYWPQGHHTVWQRAESEGTLTVRASNALYLFPDFPYDEQMKRLQELYSNDPEKLVRFNQVKIYVDGILSQGTAALLEPYLKSYGVPNMPEDGFLYFDVETLNRYLIDLDAAGFQAHIHTTGDRGTRLALDGIEQATQSNGESDKRHRITHLYMIDQQDRPRFKELNVVADFQLAPSSVDPDYIEDEAVYLGDRAYDLLPAFDMLERGATVTISSDWDADTLSPFVKIQSILSQEQENVPDLDTIIRLMTLNVAYLLHHEDKTGSLEVGKLADLIVVNQNLFETPVGEIEKTTVLLTLLGGKEVYREPSFKAGLE